MATNDAWLDQVREEILEPDLPICDPHHHLWDFRPGETVDPRYLLDELLADIGSGHNIVSTVFIECGTMFRAGAPHALAPVGETEFVNGIAAMSASGMYGPCRVAAGIVGTAYLSEGTSVGEVLDAQIVAGAGRFRGIRQAATWDASPEVGNHRTEPPPGLYLDATFRAGFAELAPRDLTFEAWCYHPQVSELADLARAFPETTIILNHIGGPIGIGPYASQRDDVFAAWRQALNELADCENTVAKLGGVGMPVMGFGFHTMPAPPTSEAFAEATRPYIDTVIEAFGPARCMFESNFPVDKTSIAYPVLWNAFKRLSSDFSASERASLFHDTATRVYRL